MAKGTSRLTTDSRYVCCDCNRMVFRKKETRETPAEDRCDGCGHKMVAVRPTMLAFGFGIGWACVLIFGIAGLSRIAPGLKEMILGVGLAVCGGLACNKIFEANRYLRGPEPAAAISRQTMAEATGAFLALLIGSVILLR